MTAQATQVYEVYIKATPQQIWDAITKPEFTEKYFYGSRVSMTNDDYLSVAGNGEALVRGKVIETDAPNRLVHTWRALYDPETAAEEDSRVTWEIESQEGGYSKLRVVHDQLEGAPKTALSVAGGWSYVLSGLKTLLETGQPLAG
ncbi:MAG: SRPBCC family protein [Actinobacteria bacterium]|nr:SRPBCC family protein [Actinomycetota bacterium]MBV8480579.1 SRPBCC family protein [Actinomycetota bacterium]